MHKDERDLLEVLKFELQFLQKGGYGRAPRESWRPLYIFEDSPTCMNYDCKEMPEPCDHCVLTQLVPPELRNEKIPCRHIPLNARGETLDALYRYEDDRDVQETVQHWLRSTIAKLVESRRVAELASAKDGAPIDAAMKGTPLFQRFHPKCANPACATAFHWLGGGRFFRFRAAALGENSAAAATDTVDNLHRVRHYWLCERCSHVFTLAYKEGSGVVLNLLWPELPLTESSKELPAALSR
ncbi:MAG: hypothetical protein WA192_15790 [Candidatus Acidiferrales bacterium]